MSNFSNIDLHAQGITDEENIFQQITCPDQVETLDLSENCLKLLPNNGSMFTRLSNLNLSKNNFRDFSSLGATLSTLPSLKSLKIDGCSQEDAYHILSNLPKLELLNDKSTKDDEPTSEEPTDYISGKNEIPNFNRITQKMISQIQKVNQSTEKFYSEFQGVLAGQIEIINHLDDKISNYLYSSHVLKATNEIYSFLLNKNLALISIRYDQQVIEIIKEINSGMNASQSKCLNIIGQMEKSGNDYNEKSQISINEKNEGLRQANDKIESGENVIKKKDGLGKQILEDNKKLNEQGNSAKALTMQELTKPKEQSKLIQKQDIIVKKVQKSANINNINIDNSTSKAQPYRKGNTNPNTIGANAINQPLHIRSNSNTNVNYKQITAAQLQSQQINPTECNKRQNTNTSYLPKSKTSISQYQKNPDHTIIGPIANHPLSMKNLLDIINDIYNSKNLNDKRLQASRLQKETMEQHMYTYLKNKYGLKNLIIEWASGIIKGIKAYSFENSEICLFGKILRNEVEEGEIRVINKLKETISSFLTHYIKNKYSLKPKSEIDGIVKKIKAGYLSEEEWTSITAYLFQETDMFLLNEKIIRYIQTNSKSQVNENKIGYHRFILIVIEFQIRGRDSYLRNFNELFYTVDKDRKGYLTEGEFYIGIEMINVYNTREELNETVKKMIAVLDPYNSGTFLYSDIIEGFHKEEIYEPNPENGELVKMSILEKLSIQYEENEE